MRKHPIIFGLLLVFLSGALFLLLFNVFFSDRPFFTAKKRVGFLTISGVISSSQEILENLKEFAEDETIKAVVVRIDSPGGSVAPAQEIYSALKNLRKNKKIVASLGTVAASGGYFVACAADKIIANPGTVTGSISAIMYFANAEELMRKIGLKASVIKSGKFKDIGSPVREMTEEERKILQNLVDDIYDQFLDIVVTERKIPREEIKKIADGRVFTGRQALALKLVDALGDKEFAIDLAAKMADIKGKPEVVTPRKKTITLLDYLLQRRGALKEALPSIPRGVYFL